MKKIFKITVILIVFVILTGCDNGKDTDHYKPQLYKHDVANNTASRVFDQVKLDIPNFNVPTISNEDKLEKSQEHIKNLETNLKYLKENRDVLKTEKKLTKREINDMDNKYKSSIEAIEHQLNKMKKTEEKYKKLVEFEKYIEDEMKNEEVNNKEE